MLHLLYIDKINQYIIPINKSPINVIITDNNKDKFGNYEIFFENLVYNNSNNFLFNIYKYHSIITKEKNTEEYINKDVVYLYENKNKAYKVTYDILRKIFINAINTKNITIDKDNKMSFTIKLKQFYNKLKNPKNITELINDIKLIRYKDKQKLPYELTKNIIKEIDGI